MRKLVYEQHAREKAAEEELKKDIGSSIAEKLSTVHTSGVSVQVVEVK